MSDAIRCDKCGQCPQSWREIDLCPECAPPVVEMLTAIYATKRRAVRNVLA